MKIFITGKPGCGKTTMVKRIVESLPEVKKCGFYTEEVREGGVRTGFLIRTLMEGREGFLAHINFKTSLRVGKYGVDVERFESLINEEFKRRRDARLFVIDEVGPMECFSSRFVEMVRELLEAPVALVGTVKLKGGGIMEEIRNSGRVSLFHLTPEKRDEIFKKIMEMIKRVI